jgi:hypothetical protein
MGGCVSFVQRLAIAVPLSAKSTTMTIANAAPNPAVAVLSLAAKWRWLWYKSWTAYLNSALSCFRFYLKAKQDRSLLHELTFAPLSPAPQSLRDSSLLGFSAAPTCCPKGSPICLRQQVLVPDTTPLREHLASSRDELVRIVFLHPHSSNPTPTAFRAQRGLPSQGSCPVGTEGSD